MAVVVVAVIAGAAAVAAAAVGADVCVNVVDVVLFGALAVVLNTEPVEKMKWYCHWYFRVSIRQQLTREKVSSLAAPALALAPDAAALLQKLAMGYAAGASLLVQD